MKKFVTFYKILIVFFLLVILGTCLPYRIGMSPVSKESEKVTLEVTSDNTYMGLAGVLKNKNLIRSELIYKVYVKLTKPNNLQRGIYVLDKNMGVKEIINTLEQGSTSNPDVIKITFPEGININKLADIIEQNTNNTKEDVYNKLKDTAYLDSLIKKYWFIENDIKNSKLYYSLEGYLYPATYEYMNKNVSVEKIFEKMLDKMDDVLSKYKKEILESKYSVHEILTFASIVEYEAKLDEDRPIIAGIFYNRLEVGMKLQSCATVGYAINEWKLVYTIEDTQVDSPYNTYVYAGLPVGPGCMPSEASIKAVLYPTENNYLYFLSNVYDNSDSKTYYSKTYKEHQQKCIKYLGKSC